MPVSRTAEHDGEPKTNNAALSAEQYVSSSKENLLPVIDVSPLRSRNDSAFETTANAIGDAALEFGFFYIKNHGIPQDLIGNTLDASECFHNQPRSWKMKYWAGFTSHHRGYVPFEENGADFPRVINHFDAWDMSWDAAADHPDFLATGRLTGPNLWPEIEGWKEVVSAYYDAVFNLGAEILRAFEHVFGVDDGALKKHVNNPISLLRLAKYLENSCSEVENFHGLQEHLDLECFTILQQRSHGLQAKFADGIWCDVPPIEDTLAVNIGDILEIWSGGLFKSTPHRVLNRGVDRYSIPFFFGLDYNTLVEPLPKFRSPEIQRKYPPLKFGERTVEKYAKIFRYMADRA